MIIDCKKQPGAAAGINFPRAIVGFHYGINCCEKQGATILPAALPPCSLL